MRTFALWGLVLVLVGCGGGSPSGDPSPQTSDPLPGPQLLRPTPVGAALNRFQYGSAGYPSLQVFTGTLYAAWHESEKILTTDLDTPRYLPAQVFVSAWNGTEWESPSSDSLNVNPGNNAIYPRLASDGAALYLAFTEWTSATAASPRTALLYVKRWNGQQWAMVGVPLNVGLETVVYGPPALEVAGGHLYVAWTEYSERPDAHGQVVDIQKVYVKGWNGQEWIPLGGALNHDQAKSANFSAMAIHNGAVTVGFFQPDLRLDEAAHENRPTLSAYIKQWTGTEWIQVGQKVQLHELPNNPSLSLASAKGRLYLAPGISMYTFSGGAWTVVHTTLSFSVYSLFSVSDTLFTIPNGLWRYDADQWTELSEPLGVDSRFASLVADPHSFYVGSAEQGDLSKAFVLAFPSP